MASTIAKLGPNDHGRRLTLAEFGQAEVEEGSFYELSRGVIVVSDVPSRMHLAVVLALRLQLIGYQLAHAGTIYGVAAGGECKLSLPDFESERHPDLAVYKKPPPEAGDLWATWVPELVVEVVSPGSVERDYVTKREEYLAFGCKEYWIVDPQRAEVLALRRRGGKWREQTLSAADVHATPLLPGFTLDLVNLFAAR